MKALVISGGGAYGSYGGGIAQYLIENGNTYDILLGTSAGSLLTPLLAIEDVKDLKKAFISVNHDDIFKSSPYKVNGNKRGKFRYFSMLWNLIKLGTSVGDSSALVDTIKRTMTKEKFMRIKDSHKIVGCCVSNVSYETIEYKYVHDNTWEDYVDWMHASSSVPPFMSVVKKGDSHYVDGGVREVTPLQRAIEHGATEIDAIVLAPVEKYIKFEEIKNIFHIISKVIDMMMEEVLRDDVTIGKLKALAHDIKLRIYYRPNLLGTSLVFHAPTMKKNWELGYKLAQEKQYKEYSIKTSGIRTLEYNGVDFDKIKDIKLSI